MVLLAAGLAGACVTAKVDVFDQKTALENQVLGSFDELSQDMLLVASVRGGEEGESKEPPRFSDTRQQAIGAMQNREFNRDDIDELKEQKLLGENAEGLLSLIEQHAVGADARAVELARRLVVEENRDREVLLRSVVLRSENLTEADLPEVRKTFYKLNVENARPGDLYQAEDGAWTEKE